MPHMREWALRNVLLDTGEPWEFEAFQADFLRDFFKGFEESWLIVPEGNGKTTLVAGLGLYHCEHVAQAYVPVAASSREQAEWCYLQAEGMVERSPYLRERFKCHSGYRRIRFYHDGSRIQIHAADDRTGDGVIPTLPILDELHRHRNLKLYSTWRGKLLKRNGQLVAISTAGEPGGEFEELRERIRKETRATKRRRCFTRYASEQFVMHEWAVPDGEDVTDMRLVARANPLSSNTTAALRRKHESPTMTDAHWRRFVCNLPTRGDRAAIQEREWDGARTDDEIPEGEPIWAGLDVAWKWDTTALVPLYIPTLEYRLLGDAEILTPPRDGTSMNPDLVEEMLLRVHHRNPIHTLVMDMSRAEQLAHWAEQALGCRVVDRPQTNTFAAKDYERFMEGLREHWLWHTGDQGLRRHVMNAVTRLLPSGAARFDRASSSRERVDQERLVIDALSAASMVHTTAVEAFTDKKESVYEERDLVVSRRKAG
jgi:phage terminase large subunit-like protein